MSEGTLGPVYRMIERISVFILIELDHRSRQAESLGVEMKRRIKMRESCNKTKIDGTKNTSQSP